MEGRGASSGSVLQPIPAGPAEPSPFAVLEFSYEGLFLEAYRLLPVDTGNESSVLRMVLAFLLSYLIYHFRVRLKLEGKGRT